MNFNDFKNLTKEEKLKAIESADLIDLPFWMERLRTALNKMAPQVLSIFEPAVMEIYRELTE